jgi:hypothetical protein
VRYTAWAVDDKGLSSPRIQLIVAVDWSDDYTPPAGDVVTSSSSTAGTMVGTLPGQFAVDNKGNANYTIPLAVLPGRGGLQPSLALSYSSGGGNGPLGVGVSLSTGFPQAITRGRTILARDSEVKGINFTTDDKLYLDGKRLLLISGTNGEPGSVYRTEVDSFMTITAVGTGTKIDGFRVLTKEGLALCFGKGVKDDANQSYYTGTDAYHVPAGETNDLALSWALKWVEDTVGNYVEFLYDQTPTGTTSTGYSPVTGEHLLTAIRYTGNRTAATPIAPAFTCSTLIPRQSRAPTRPPLTPWAAPRRWSPVSTIS